MRLGDLKKALDALAKDVAGAASERGEHGMLRGVALGRLGNSEAGHRELVDARVFSISSGDSTLEAEVEYYVAYAEFATGDLDAARKSCRRALREPTPSSRRIIPMLHVVARIEELLGVIAASAGKYRENLAHARNALTTLDSCEIKDVWHEAFAISNLSVLVRDFDLRDDALSVATRTGALAWTPDVASKHFTTLDSLAWCAMLRGEEFDALRLFRNAEHAATTVPERVYVSVARAVHARSLGRATVAAEETEHALLLADAFDWNAAAGDSRNALLELAQAAAVVSPDRARAVLKRYTSLRSSVPARFASRLEVRVRAEEAYSEGLVLRAEGQVSASLDRLASAFRSWNAIGYAWRAARAALELAELDAGEVFRHAVRHELHVRPHSVFADRARLVA